MYVLKLLEPPIRSHQGKINLFTRTVNNIVMPWRYYPTKEKYRKRDGTISEYKGKSRKWIKSNKPYKPQKRGAQRPLLWSKRFGFLNMYDRREQHELKCPSGFTIAQCFNLMRKLWCGYHASRTKDKDYEKMKKYAKKIQEVQEDLGIKTTSFPHLELYGEVLVLNNKETKKLVFTDHSALKKKQEAYQKWQAENAKQIQDLLQKPDKEKGEEIVTFADDRYPLEEDQEDWEITVPNLLEPNEEEGEELIVITDDIPFRKDYRSLPG